MRIMIADDEMPARRELGYLLEQCMPEAALCYAESGEMVLAMLKEKEVDVLFADIHLGDRNGMSMASVLRREYPDMQIVFATAYEDYAVKAFEMNALDYITKPFELKRVEQTVQKILAKGSMYSGSKLFDLAVSCGMEKLPVSSNKNILLVDLKGHCLHGDQRQRRADPHAAGGIYGQCGAWLLREAPGGTALLSDSEKLSHQFKSGEGDRAVVQQRILRAYAGVRGRTAPDRAHADPGAEGNLCILTFDKKKKVHQR